MSTSAEAREWHRIIRASVRECVETWGLHAEAGPVTVEAMETILARATVPILNLLQDQPPEAVVALMPSVVRTMLWAVLEMQAESAQGRRPEPKKGSA
jgi:uncharacterized protein (DUF362 family)